jgi:hypothetical protein
VIIEFFGNETPKDFALAIAEVAMYVCNRRIDVRVTETKVIVKWRKRTSGGHRHGSH